MGRLARRLACLCAALLACSVTVVAGRGAQSYEGDAQIASALSSGRIDDQIVAMAMEAVADAERRQDRRGEARALEQLGQVHVARGDFARAQGVLERAAAIWVAMTDVGAEARVLEQLADTQIRRGVFEEAAATVARLRGIRQGQLAVDPQQTVVILELEATLHRKYGRYGRARTGLDDALTMARASSVPPARQASLLHQSGDVAYLMGDIQRAGADYQAALAAARRAFGDSHPAVVPYLGKVAVSYSASGDLGTARDLRVRAVQIAEGSLPPCHPDLVVTYNDLAISDVYFGDYAGSRRMFERVLTLAQRCFGPADSVTAMALGNVGNILKDLGDFDGAEQMQRQSIVAWTASRGATHPFVAIAVEGLAEVLAAQGRLSDAIVAYDRALAIRTSASGESHPSIAALLTLRANVLTEQRRFTAALRDLDRAASIYQRNPSVEEPDQEAKTRMLLLRGRVEEALGHVDKARDAYAAAVDLRQRLYGAAHPRVAQAQALMARMEMASGDRQRAFTEALESEAISRDHLRRTVRYLSERQALDYVSLRPQSLDLVISLAADGGDVRSGFDAVIRSRGLVLDELAARARAGHEDPRITSEAMQQFVTARRRYANLTVQSLRESVPRARLDAARQAAEEAERLIAEQSVTARAEQGRANAGLGELLASLPTGAALVSFVRYAPPANRTSNAAPMYGAFIVDADRKGPVFVKIGIAARVEELVRTWRAEASRRTSTSMTAAGVALRRVVWDPVAPLTGNATRVFIVGDGALGLVSFAALPRDSGGYLVEDERVLHVLSTERDLLLPVDTVRRPSALIVGGPSFAGSRPVTQTAMRAGIDCRGGSPLAFTELPGARVEAQEVSSLWSQTGARDVLMLSGTEATETAVKRALSGRRVIHLATHGFFFGAGCNFRETGTRAVGGVVAANAPTAFVRNPLTLAGLAFANANRRMPGTDDDGILTAEEIASLDLSGTEWAVLSACDTGLGQIRSGEGVLGLRRAFQIAGARTVIMSLWSVDDQATRHWMQALYDARLTRNLDTAASVRAASIAILSQRRAAKLSTHPFYWAAFVAAGDWR